MRAASMLSGVAILAILLAAPAQADDWDGDDDVYNRYLHDLTHGSNEPHDLAARPGPVADVDWYVVPQDPYTSWEVTIDGLTAPSGSVDLDRVDSGGGVIQAGVHPTLAGGQARSLWWANASASPMVDLVRVQGADCSTACKARSRYRMRAYETTISVPRFNNSGTQVTVLLIQNTLAIARSGTVYFWNATGTQSGSQAFSLAPHALQVMNTGTIVPSVSGSITIVHDAGYGGLSAKAVVLEPATGFSFDTPGTYKPK
jgi:opacity protein-like surface antigen